MKPKGNGKMQHAHPAVAIELTARKQFTKHWTQLGLADSLTKASGSSFVGL